MPSTQRFRDANWRFFAYFLIVPIATFFTLTMTGCVTTSPGLPNLHLVNIYVSTATRDSNLQVRIGYFGICIGKPHSFACSSTHGVSASQLTSRLVNATGMTPESESFVSAVKFAMTLQGKIFPPLLAASGAIFAVGIMALLLLQRDMREGEQVVRGYMMKNLSPRRTERYRKVTTLLFFIALGLALASAVAVTQATAGIQYTSENIGRLILGLEQTNNAPAKNETWLPVHAITGGKASQILHWLIVGFLAVFSVSMARIFDTSFWNVLRNPYLKGEHGMLPKTLGGVPSGAGVPGPPMPLPPLPMAQIPPPPPPIML